MFVKLLKLTGLLRKGGGLVNTMFEQTCYRHLWYVLKFVL